MSYKLQKNNKHLSKIFDIISENIQDSVFKKLGLRFFVIWSLKNNTCLQC